MEFNKAGGNHFGGGMERFAGLTPERKAEFEARRAERKAKWEAMSPEDREAAKAQFGRGHRAGRAFGDLSALLQQTQQS
jgi:hypothetical protein